MTDLIVWSLYGVLLGGLVGWLLAAPGEVADGFRGLWATSVRVGRELWRGLLGFPGYVREVGRRG